MSQDDAGAIQRGGGTPLHHQVFLVIRSAILSGRYAEGQMLPSEDDFAKTFGVSRVTVRNALATLRALSLVEKRRGVGTFVSTGRLLEKLRVPNADLMKHVRSVGASTQVKVLDVSRVAAPAHLQEFFQCEPDAQLHRIVRLRSIGARPVFHVVTYLSDAVGSLSRSDFHRQSLYTLLAERGVELSSGRQIVSAALADPSLARHLQTMVGAALLYIRRFHYDQHGVPTEYIEFHATPQSFEIEMTLGSDEIGTHRVAG